MKTAVAIALAIVWTSSPSLAQSCFEADPLLPVTGDQPWRIALGDFDADGDLDLGTHDSQSAAFTTRRNLGGGAWEFAIPVPAALGTRHFEFLDVDGDGNADLVSADEYGGVSVQLSLGAAGFASVQSVFIPGQVNHFATGDLDNDGDPDLAVAATSIGQDGARILLNQGNGTFVAGPSLIADTRRIAIGDFDADGDGDLAILTNPGSSVHVTLNDGQGGFPGVPTAIPISTWPIDVITGDFDGDGRSDLVIGQNGEIFAMLISTPGGFAPNVEHRTPHPVGQLAAGDLDEDGDLDLVVVGNHDDVSIFANLGNGDFSSASTLAISPWANSLAGGDIDADGDFDLAFPIPAADAALVWRNCVVSGTPTCFGDGSATACPCGNASPVGAGAGCLHSLGTGGTLRASGAASLAADTVVLRGASMPDAPALYFQGTSAINGGLGNVFGDGLRCAGGSVARLATATNVGGASQVPGAGQPPVSVLGGVTVPGERHYQVWYRNAASYCTPATFNLTNSLRLTWRP